MLDHELIPAQDSNSRRLLIMLHGLGDSTSGYDWMPTALQLPWLNYLLVNAPDPYFGGFSWYDFSGDAGQGVRRSRKLLFQLLDDQQARGFPAEQMILGGFSQGGLMTIDVGLRYPHRFAGLISISGYVFEPQNLIQELSSVARQQQLLLTHGTDDPLIPIEPVRQQVQVLQAAGLQIQWREFRKAHTIAGEEELRVIREFVRRSAERPKVYEST